MKITYIIAIYNVKECLDECIQSVISDKSDTEIILVDDGSTDGSGEICDQYAESDFRIRVVHQENQGVSVARNTGLELASGDWICFVDGDDGINSNLGTVVQSYLDQTADIIFFSYSENTADVKSHEVKDADQKLLNRKDILTIRAGLLNSDMPEMEFYKHHHINCHSPWGKLYRRDFIEKNQLRFTKGVKKGQDMLFNFDVYKFAQRITFVPVTGYFYRQRETSISHQYNKHIEEINLKLISEFKKRVDTENSRLIKDNFWLFTLRQFMFCMLLHCCHPQNPMKYRERARHYLRFRNQEIFKSAFKNADVKKLRFQVRIFCFFAKYRMFWGMELISRVKCLLGR